MDLPASKSLSISSDFTFSTRKKAAFAKDGKVKLEGHRDAFRRSQFLKTAAAMGTWAKEESCTYMNGLISPKTTLNLC
jgi:hypothetical protein